MLPSNYTCDGQLDFFQCLEAIKERNPSKIGQAKRPGLSQPTIKILERAGITTIAELRSKSRDDLIKIRGMGARAMREIEDRLKGLD